MNRKRKMENGKWKMNNERESFFFIFHFPFSIFHYLRHSKQSEEEMNIKLKIILWTVLLLCAAMPAVAQGDKKVVKSKSNITNNRASNEQALMTNEKATWKNLVDKKYDAFGKLLADDYQSVYGLSRNTKESELGGIVQTTFKSAVVSDLKVQWASDKVGIVTALVKAEIVGADAKAAVTTFRTTSVYANREGAWLLVFHTDEPLTDAK
jgi:hypothetical protein